MPTNRTPNARIICHDLSDYIINNCRHNWKRCLSATVPPPPPPSLPTLIGVRHLAVNWQDRAREGVEKEKASGGGRGGETDAKQRGGKLAWLIDKRARVLSRASVNCSACVAAAAAAAAVDAVTAAAAAAEVSPLMCQQLSRAVVMIVDTLPIASWRQQQQQQQ